MGEANASTVDGGPVARWPRLFVLMRVGMCHNREFHRTYTKFDDTGPFPHSFGTRHDDGLVTHAEWQMNAGLRS